MRLGILVIAVLGAGLGWLRWWQQRSTVAAAWQGYADADYVKVAPVEAGRLTRLTVARGDWVEKAAPLFKEDDEDERAARDQAARQLAQAEQQLANLEAGAKPMEVAEAEANVADAQSALDRARDDLERDEALSQRGYAPAQLVDQRRADFLSAKAKAEHAEAALDDARGPMGRQREIDAQRAAVAAAQAPLAMAEWRLEQRTVAAPVAGRIADVMAQPGETIAAGVPVVSILPPQNIFVRFFVPETALASLHADDPVAFGCDGCPLGLTGTISFISPAAEYTPPVIYSQSTRSKLVYLIEARPRAEAAALLNPGQPMDVHPIAGATRR